MRTHPLTVHAACPGHSQKGSHLQLLSLSTEAPRRPVWLWLLTLSVLCSSTWAYDQLDTESMQICLQSVIESIQKFDSTLYAPSVDEIKKNCERWFLHCYMLELEMILFEERIEGSDANCIFNFNKTLNESLVAYAESCPPCETTPLRNSTTFLKNLQNLLQKINSQLAQNNM